MRIRFIVAALTASALAGVSCGCSPNSAKVAQKTAQITVDGKTLTSHAVSCTQVEWLLTVDINAAPARVQMVLNLDHAKPKPESVNIDNLNGFTGVVGGDTGNAQAVFAGDTYTVTGAAQGTNPSDATSRTAVFRISAKC